MTKSEFLDALSKTPRGWRVHNGCIRQKDQCPMQFLFSDRVSWSDYLGSTVVDLIICAADGHTDRENQCGMGFPKAEVIAFRKELLTACGLEEEVANVSE